MLNEIINFVSEDYRIPIEKINGTTLIEEDLGITGDDAWELMEYIEEKYGINLSAFDFSKHFSPEAGTYVSDEYGYYPISINHLVDIINLGKWKLPIKNEENYIKQKYRRKMYNIYKILLLGIVVILVLNFA